MSEPTPQELARVATTALLESAASASVEAELALDDFMRAAWSAYTDARPGLRAGLEVQAMRARLDDLRARGQLALA